MATLSTQTVVPAGITPTYAAASAGGDKVVPADHVFLVVKNGGASSVTVTVDDPNSQSPSGAAAFNPDLSVSVGAATEKWIGPLTAARFAAAADGLAAVTYSGVTSVTVAAVKTG